LLQTTTISRKVTDTGAPFVMRYLHLVLPAIFVATIETVFGPRLPHLLIFCHGRTYHDRLRNLAASCVEATLIRLYRDADSLINVSPGMEQFLEPPNNHHHDDSLADGHDDDNSDDDQSDDDYSDHMPRTLMDDYVKVPAKLFGHQKAPVTIAFWGNWTKVEDVVWESDVNIAALLFKHSHVGISARAVFGDLCNMASPSHRNARPPLTMYTNIAELEEHAGSLKVIFAMKRDTHARLPELITESKCDALKKIPVVNLPVMHLVRDVSPARRLSILRNLFVQFDKAVIKFGYRREVPAIRAADSLFRAYTSVNKLPASSPPTTVQAINIAAIAFNGLDLTIVTPDTRIIIERSRHFVVTQTLATTHFALAQTRVNDLAFDGQQGRHFDGSRFHNEAHRNDPVTATCNPHAHTAIIASVVKMRLLDQWMADHPNDNLSAHEEDQLYELAQTLAADPAMRSLIPDGVTQGDVLKMNSTIGNKLKTARGSLVTGKRRKVSGLATDNLVRPATIDDEEPQPPPQPQPQPQRKLMADDKEPKPEFKPTSMSKAVTVGTIKVRTNDLRLRIFVDHVFFIQIHQKELKDADVINAVCSTAVILDMTALPTWTFEEADVYSSYTRDVRAAALSLGRITLAPSTVVHPAFHQVWQLVLAILKMDALPATDMVKQFAQIATSMSTSLATPMVRNVSGVTRADKDKRASASLHVDLLLWLIPFASPTSVSPTPFPIRAWIPIVQEVARFTYGVDNPVTATIEASLRAFPPAIDMLRRRLSSPQALSPTRDELKLIRFAEAFCTSWVDPASLTLLSQTAKAAWPPGTKFELGTIQLKEDFTNYHSAKNKKK